MAGDISRENGKLGGRPSGSRSFTTIMRDAMLAEIRSRTHDVTNDLFFAQLTLALGFSELWRIEKELVVGPKGGQKYVKKRPERVTDTATIEEYITAVIDGNDDGALGDDSPDATYFYIVTVPPNNQALEALQERTLGKTPQQLGLGNPDGSPLGDSPIIRALTTRLNDVHGTAGVGGDGAPPDAVGDKAPGEERVGAAD